VSLLLVQLSLHLLKVQLVGDAQPGTTFAFGINNAGQIAGYYSDTTAQPTAS
jgi:hypothetical protein